MKTCTKCSETKPDEAFQKGKTRCRVCLNEYERWWKSTTPEERRAIKEAKIQAKKNAAEKTCTSCKIVKSKTEFSFDKRSPDGHCYQCKVCVANHAKVNREAIYERTKEWLAANPDKRKEYTKRNYYKNREKLLAENKAWREANPEKLIAYRTENSDIFAHQAAKRRTAKLNATPPWVDAAHIERIKFIYKLAKVLTKITGIPYHVDHIEPLQGENSSGLHVWWNLKPIEGKKNLSKGNKLIKELNNN